MATYLTPGVYYERADATVPAITAIRTDVAGFAGLAPRGLLDTPVPVESWRQFEAHFGGFTGAGFLAYAVRGFFENGGRRCWVVRVASNDPVGGARSAGLDLASLTTPGRLIWRVSASSPGVWGNTLSVRFQETHLGQTIGRLEKDHPTRLAVATTTGFARGTMVRLSQPSRPPVLRVVATIDATRGFLSDNGGPPLLAPNGRTPKFLVWVPRQPALRVPYDASALNFDPDAPILVESIEYTLVVEQGSVPIALYRGLSLIPEHANYGPGILGPLVIPADVEAQRYLPPLPQPVLIEELRPEFQPASPAPLRPLELVDLLTDTTPLEGGADGLRILTTYDFMGEPSDPLDSDQMKKGKTRGLRALEAINEVSMLAVPDINIQPIAIPPTVPLPPCVPDPCLPGGPVPEAPAPPPADLELSPTFSDTEIYRVQAAMVQQCEDLRDRIALLDPPRSASRDDRLGVGAAQAWRSLFDTSYAAFYYPWLRVADPLRSPYGPTRDIPPSGHVAGQYAQTDLTVGVHKAPANQPLVWVQDVTVAVNAAQQGILNPQAINAIRTLPGRGIRIFGARTTSSDPDWRYVNVRRLLMMIEKAIRLSTQWAVFEPNDELTWAKLRLSLTSFLISLWQAGALVGNTVEEAFFVRCDETTNPPSERSEGDLVALVGVAPSYPYEFVVVRVGRTGNEFEISEQGVRRGGK